MLIQKIVKPRILLSGQIDKLLKVGDKKIKPVLNIEFLSHGTVEIDDVDASRKFYEEFLGLEVVRTSPISLMFRLGGTHSYAAVKRGGKKTKMGLLFHNGLDVASDEEVDKCHKLCVEQADKWGMTQVTKPIAQHGGRRHARQRPDQMVPPRFFWLRGEHTPNTS